MHNSWNKSETWIARFDILGFKHRLNYNDKSALLDILMSSVDEVIETLDKDIRICDEILEYTSYADTFIIYSERSDSGYPELVRASENFLTTCVLKKLPVRGAISYGELILGHDNKMMMGKAFLECYEYGEDQNWIGLILTPTASIQLKSMDIDPTVHGFVSGSVPLRKYSVFDQNIYAYDFTNSTKYAENQLLPVLDEMLQEAPVYERVKYINTIRFIEKCNTTRT